MRESEKVVGPLSITVVEYSKFSDSNKLHWFYRAANLAYIVLISFANFEKKARAT